MQDWVYKSWCSEQCVSPYSSSVEDMANFLVYLHEVKGYRESNIAGYMAAIATVHKSWSKGTVSL